MIDSSLPAQPAVPGASPAPDGDTMAHIKHLLDKGFLWLKFPAALERQFLLDMADARRRHFLFSGWIALVVYNGFLIVDYLMANDVFWLAVELRVFLFTPVALFVLLLLSGSTRLSKSLPPLAQEIVVLASGLAAAVSLAFILSETRSSYGYFYHVGFTVVIMYGNLVQRLRFWYAMVFTLALLFIHVTGILLLEHFPARMLGPIVSLVCSTSIFSLVANYAMERDERMRYLLTLRERGVVRELTQAHERLQALSRMDGLTGLFNRRHFQEYLQQVWERAQYDQAPISILMVDVDHFKKYNDRYGHPAGDECLRQVAAVLQGTLRHPGDLVARYGGEEFIAVLPQTSCEDATMVAERIREAVEGLRIRHESSTTALVATVSVGVASCQADFLLKDTALIAAADDALYRAKHEGRNRVCVRALPSVRGLEATGESASSA